MNIRSVLRKNKGLRFLASIKLTVVCLILLFILTFWGTIAQVQNGLYLTQERFFYSWFFLAMGFIPFPGAQLVMWVLFANLISVALIRLVYKGRHIGIITIHFGLLLFLISGYVTLHCSKESYLSLREGEGRNVSTAYHDWEIAVWEEDAGVQAGKTGREVTTVDDKSFHPGVSIDFIGHDFKLKVKEYYKNCDAFTGGAQPEHLRNASGIFKLTPLELQKELEKNTPGGIFTVSTKQGENFDLILFGAESTPTTFSSGGKMFTVSLRPKHYPLPFTIQLKDFIKERHPGTDTPRSFKSLVEVYLDKAGREKEISMNNPLRFNEYTLYQASYSIDKQGREASTLAVVQNSGRMLPYIATLVTFLGLVIHSLVMALISKKNYESPFINEA